jgi:hypothetical protein
MEVYSLSTKKVLVKPLPDDFLRVMSIGPASHEPEAAALLDCLRQLLEIP